MSSFLFPVKCQTDESIMPLDDLVECHTIKARITTGIIFGIIVFLCLVSIIISLFNGHLPSSGVMIVLLVCGILYLGIYFLSPFVYEWVDTRRVDQRKYEYNNRINQVNGLMSSQGLSRQDATAIVAQQQQQQLQNQQTQALMNRSNPGFMYRIEANMADNFINRRS